MGNYNILTVFPPAKDEVADLLISTLVDSYGDQVSVHPARHEAAALDYLNRLKYHLIISDLNIPADGKSIPNEEEKLGLTFLEKLEKDNKFKSIPKILVVPRKEIKLFETVQNFLWTKIISYDDAENFQSEFIQLVQLALKPKSPVRGGPDKPFGNVIIEIDPENSLGNNVQGRFEIQSEDSSFNPKGNIYFNQYHFNKLIEQSDELMEMRDYDKWERKLRRIGLDLTEEFFSNENKKFNQSFNQLKGRVIRTVEDIKYISIKFILKREWHSILFEAFVEEEDSPFWMLHAPIYRGCSIDPSIACNYANPLFEGDDDTPLNCLIIKADTEGYVKDMKVGGKDYVLQHLFHLENECTWLENTFFPMLKQQGIILNVMKMEEKPGQDFYETVIAELEKGKWHLVHYAGHSVYGEYKGRKGSFLFFPHQDGLLVKDIEYFCMHLRQQTRLIYLSSCSSGGSGFVFKMAEYHVPAIVGFRWDIDDELAFEFTKTFYRHLFEKKSLETAFLETRRNMYESQRESKIWAAPILITQTSLRKEK